MPADRKKILQDLLTKGQKKGAENLEIFFLSSKDLDIQVTKQRVENIKLAEEMGIGIRAYKNQAMGFAYTSNLEMAGLERVLSQAITNASYTSQDPFNVLPKRDTNYPQVRINDREITEAPLDEKIALAIEIEKETRAYDPRVKNVQRAGYKDIATECIILNSLGLAASYQSSSCGGYCLAVAEENGEQQSGFGFQYDLRFKGLNPSEIAKQAARNATRLLGATQIVSQHAPLVLDPYVATSFLGLIAPALSAEAVQKEKSFLGRQLGHQITKETVNIIDDGTLPGGLLSAPCDDEGVAMAKKYLVQEGFLEKFLHNTYTAAKANTQSTGNGLRGSFRATPEVASSNLYFQAGDLAPEQIIAEIKQGFYVTNVMGLHTANSISGDFSLGASGIWIDKGVLTKPVRGIAIAGNLYDILLNIDLIGNDLTFFGGKGSPTIKINNISISGGI